MQDNTSTPFNVTTHKHLDEAIPNREIRAKTPVVDEHGSCLDFVLVPMHPGQAHEMLTAALRSDAYDMCLKAEYANDEEEVHLEIVSQETLRQG